jgi:hypothetical protein
LLRIVIIGFNREFPGVFVNWRADGYPASLKKSLKERQMTIEKVPGKIKSLKKGCLLVSQGTAASNCFFKRVHWRWQVKLGRLNVQAGLDQDFSASEKVHTGHAGIEIVRDCHNDLATDETTGTNDLFEAASFQLTESLKHSGLFYAALLIIARTDFYVSLCGSSNMLTVQSEAKIGAVVENLEAAASAGSAIFVSHGRAKVFGTGQLVCACGVSEQGKGEFIANCVAG